MIPDLSLRTLSATARLLLLAPTGGIRDTLALVDGYETFVVEFADSRPPFAKRSHFAVHEDRLYFGDAEEVGYRVGSLAGDERRVARIADYPLELTAEERERAE